MVRFEPIDHDPWEAKPEAAPEKSNTSDEMHQIMNLFQRLLMQQGQSLTTSLEQTADSQRSTREMVQEVMSEIQKLVTLFQRVLVQQGRVLAAKRLKTITMHRTATGDLVADVTEEPVE